MRVYSIIVRNCWSWGWLSVTVLPALMALSMRPFTTMLVTARRLERSMFLRWWEGEINQARGREGGRKERR